MDYSNTANLCSPLGTADRMKRRPTEREEIFADLLSDKGFISRTPALQKKKTKKWAEDLNRHFSKEDKQMGR